MTTSPPVAERRPSRSEHHGVALTDDYAWLRQYPKVTDEAILDHLKAENAWFEAQMAPHEELVEAIFREMKGRIKEDDSTVPIRDGAYWRWSTFKPGQQYRQHWRRRAMGDRYEESDAPDELLFDENAAAEGHDYFNLGELAVSPDDRLLAYATDVDGSERFTLGVRDLTTGEELPDVIPGMLSSIAWTGDSRGFLYGLANDNWRTDSIRHHRLGTDPADDPEIFHEDDEGFRADVGTSAQEDWLIVSTGDAETSEHRLIPATDPTAEPILVSPREVGRLYDVDVRDGTVWVHTNDAHPNFRLATAPLGRPGEWTTVIEGSDERYLTDFDLYRDFLVTETKVAGLPHLEVRRYDAPESPHVLALPEASYDAGFSGNPDYDTGVLRLTYTSMVTPVTVYDYHVGEDRLEVRKVQEVPSGYDSTGYATERLMVEARDGTEVPVSIVYAAGFPRDGSRPLHLYAYGSYGHAIPPSFSPLRLSLVDRGFAFAIAHVRGGDDLGRAWFEAGKLDRRMNSFTDLVDVGRGLVARGYSAEGRVVVSGGSAGGSLVGVAINLAPELFAAAALHVPFVDILNTMLDQELPLTPGEWPLWGNPAADRAAFDTIAAYSPYDRIERRLYPAVLVTAGLNDPRVTYWEPAKYVAKLRAHTTSDRPVLLKVNLGAGHGGKSGRWDRLREVAEEAVFFLWQTGSLAGS